MNSSFAYRTFLTLLCTYIIATQATLGFDVRSLLKTVDELEQPIKKEYEAKPLPCGPDAYTLADDKKLHEKFYARNFIEAYKQHGMRGDEWDADAIQYLTEMSRLFSGYYPAIDAEELRALCKAVFDKGCRDPLMLYFYALLISGQKDSGEYEKRLQLSIDQFEKFDGYSMFARSHPVNALVSLLSWKKDEREKEFEKWYFKLKVMIKAAALDGSYRDDDLRYYYSNFLTLDRALDERLIDDAFDLIIEDELIDPWLRHTIAGKYYIKTAWDARGSSWARNVTKDGWEVFRKNISLARRALVKAWEIDPSRPEPATLMITVCMAESGKIDPERLWFDRAVAAHFEYKYAYDTYLFSVYPRWGGSHKEMYDFAVECVETARYDTSIPGLFVDILAKIDYDIDSTELFRDLPETRKHMRAVTAGYVEARKDDPKEYDYWRTMYVGLAWQEEEFTRARRMLDEMDGAFKKDHFKRYFRIPWSWARREIFAMTDNCSDEMKKARRLVEDRIYHEAIDIYSNAMSSCESRAAKKFAKGKFESAKMLNRFAKEERVDLEPTKAFKGWRATAGQWRLDTNGWITGRAVRPGLWIVFEQEFPNDIEIAGEMVFEESANDTNITAGIAFGLTDPDPQSFASLMLHKDENVVTLSREDRYESGLRKPLPIETTNTFNIHIWKRQVVVYVNDQPVHYVWRLNTMLAAHTFKIALGNPYAVPGTVLKYRNVYVRKLDEDPLKILGTKMVL